MRSTCWENDLRYTRGPQKASPYWPSQSMMISSTSPSLDFVSELHEMWPLSPLNSLTRPGVPSVGGTTGLQIHECQGFLEITSNPITLECHYLITPRFRMFTRAHVRLDGAALLFWASSVIDYAHLYCIYVMRFF